MLIKSVEVSRPIENFGGKMKIENKKCSKCQKFYGKIFDSRFIEIGNIQIHHKLEFFCMSCGEKLFFEPISAIKMPKTYTTTETKYCPKCTRKMGIICDGTYFETGTIRLWEEIRFTCSHCNKPANFKPVEPSDDGAPGLTYELAENKKYEREEQK